MAEVMDMKKKALFVAIAVLVGAALPVLADGAGGVTLGYYASSYALTQRWQIPYNIENLMCIGGYGYGVDRHGLLNGGFGLALVDTGSGSGAAGGVGGFITGFRLLRFPVHLALVSWTGVGGLFTGESGANPGRGYFVGFEEASLELGIPLAPWFMPTVYVGYQLTANLVPGPPFMQNVTYAPVVGVRVAWGDFR